MKLRYALIPILLSMTLCSCDSLTKNIDDKPQHKWQITWKNYDSTVLDVEFYSLGEVPSYKGETPVHPNDGNTYYVFDGWDPSITAVDRDATYVAKFRSYTVEDIDVETYNVTFYDYDFTVLQFFSVVEYGTTVYFTAKTPTKPEDSDYTYEFVGWNPEIGPITKNTQYFPVFNSIPKVDRHYTVTFDTLGGSEIQSQVVKEGECPIFPDQPLKHYYYCDGWLNGDGNKCDPSKIPVYSDITYYANWIDGTVVLDVVSNNESLGYVEGGAMLFYGVPQGLTAHVTSPYAKFDGWYYDGKLLSIDNPYRLIVNVYNYMLIEGRFVLNELGQQCEKGILPHIDLSDGTLTYGYFPQSRVTDSSLESALDNAEATIGLNSQGYVDYNGSMYKSVVVPNTYNGMKFNDGVERICEKKYWFIVEPIVWDIISSDSGEYELITNRMLYNFEGNSFWTRSGVDGKNEKRELTDYNGETAIAYANEYKYSPLRTWTNTDFIKNSFRSDKLFMEVLTIDNAFGTMYDSATTYDLVKVLSVDEYEAVFANHPEIEHSKATDFAIASGYFSYSGDEFYWTRTPGFDEDGNGQHFYHHTTNTGKYTVSYPYEKDWMVGIRPSITINESSIVYY